MKRAILFGFVCLALTLRAQAPPAGHVMTLEVVASDKAGTSIHGLTAQDFTLLDNKQPQPITSFRAVENISGDPPTQAILLVDEVNDSFSNVAFERQQITIFLQRDEGRLALPISLAFFTDKGLTDTTQPSTDGKVLAQAVKEDLNPQHTIRRSQGFYGAADRTNLSLKTLGQIIDYEKKQPGRKLLVWISPGWPLLSGPRVELSTKNQEEIFRSIIAFSDGLREANITLDSIDPLGTADAASLRTSYYETFLKGVKRQPDVQFGDLGLQVLATQSGGRVLNSSNDITAQVSSALKDAGAFYVLTFQSAAADGPNDYHSLEVKVNRPGVKVRTRTGYYAQPEAKGN